jgi:hypothetical protein
MLANNDNVGRVTAACSFCVISTESSDERRKRGGDRSDIRMDGSPFKCCNSAFNEAGFVQGISVDVDLPETGNVELKYRELHHSRLT